tara:strand:- start:2410 stop:2607 length:198 start_codon:yes stop_codon:yes gene_type:complete
MVKVTLVHQPQGVIAEYDWPVVPRVNEVVSIEALEGRSFKVVGVYWTVDRSRVIKAQVIVTDDDD